MKKLMAITIIFAVSITLAWSQDLLTSGATHIWTVLITPQTTKHYLDSLEVAWSKENIVLSFSKLKYNSKGKLVKVKGSIDIMARGTHATGTFTSNSLQSFEVKVNDSPGVYIKGK